MEGHPVGLFNPVGFLLDFISKNKLSGPKISFVVINAFLQIIECKMTISSSEASGLGKTNEEAQRAAYLAHYDKIFSQPVEMLSPALRMDPSKPWFEQPRPYLHGLAARFGKKLEVETSQTSPARFRVKIIFDEGNELAYSSECVSKKEATHQAALHLCLLINDFIAKNGPPFKQVPEYKKYLGLDLPNAAFFPWYPKARDWVSRIASFAVKRAAVFETIKAPLDPGSFLCTVTVDAASGIIGHGRAATEKEAARLASVDLCSRSAHLLQPQSAVASGLNSLAKGFVSVLPLNLTMF